MNISHSVENEYLRRHPVDAAEQLETIRDPELEPVVGSLDPRALGIAMEYLSPPKAIEVLRCFPGKRSSRFWSGLRHGLR